MNKGAIPITIYLNLALWGKHFACLKKIFNVICENMLNLIILNKFFFTNNHNLADDQQHDDDCPDNETEVAQDEPLHCFIRFNIGHLIILI